VRKWSQRGDVPLSSPSPFPFLLLRARFSAPSFDRERREYSLNSPLLGRDMKSPSSPRSPSARGAAERRKKGSGREQGRREEKGQTRSRRRRSRAGRDVRAEGRESISSAHDPSSVYARVAKVSS